MDSVRISIIFEARTTLPPTLERMLEALETFRSFAPTHWGPTERKRIVWSRAEVLQHVAQQKSEWRVIDNRIELWRTKAPKLTGHASTSDAEVNELHLELSPAPTTEALRALFETTSKVVALLPTVLAYVSPVWALKNPVDGMTREQMIDLNAGGSTTEKQLKKVGLTSVAARTWFGPMLVERLGESLLRQLGAVDAREGGTLVLDVVAEPWLDLPRELAHGKSVAMKALRATKMIAKRGKSDELTPGSAWTVPSWKRAREVVDAEEEQ